MRLNSETSIGTKGEKSLFLLRFMAVRIIHIWTCQGPPGRGDLWETQPPGQSRTQRWREMRIPGFSYAWSQHNPWVHEPLHLLSLSYPVCKRFLLLATQRVPNNVTNQLPPDFAKSLHLWKLSFLICMRTMSPASLKDCNESQVRGWAWPPFKNCTTLLNVSNWYCNDPSFYLAPSVG